MTKKTNRQIEAELPKLTELEQLAKKEKILISIIEIYEEQISHYKIAIADTIDNLSRIRQLIKQIKTLEEENKHART